MKVLLEAPIMTRSGYGEHSRLVYRSLKTIPDVKIEIMPLNWGNTSWVSEDSVNKEELKEIQESIESHSQSVAVAKSSNTPINYDIHVHVGIPNEFEKKASHSVCVTAGIETDRVDASWLIKTYQGIDKIIVPSEHSKEVFMKTSYEALNETNNTKTTIECNCPVDVVPYPTKTFSVSETLDFTLPTKFNFLSVALLGPRKNLEKMVKLFIDEFSENPEVGLVLKTGRVSGSLMDRNFTVAHFSRLVENYRPDKKCKIYILHGDLSDEEIHSLYTRDDIHAYITATHGEGYGLPIFEAAYSGMPIVATDWSGHLDFLSAEYKESGKIKTKKLFARVDYNLDAIPQEAVWKNIVPEGSKWANPNGVSFRKQLKNIYKNLGMYKKWAAALKKSLEQTHNNDKILKTMASAIVERSSTTQVTPENNEEVLVL